MSKSDVSDSKYSPFKKALEYTKTIFSFLLSLIYFFGWVFNDADNVKDGLNLNLNMNWIEIISGILFVVTLGAFSLYVIYISKIESKEAVTQVNSSLNDRINTLNNKITALEKQEEKINSKLDSKADKKLQEANFEDIEQIKCTLIKVGIELASKKEAKTYSNGKKRLG